MAGRKSDFTLTKLDDLFTTQAQRDEEQLSKIRDIPLELIDDFPDHPFKVRDDEDMMLSLIHICNAIKPKTKYGYTPFTPIFTPNLIFTFTKQMGMV